MKGATTIQERLKDLRVERHLKLEELEAATGISSSALGSYENDKNNNKEINHGSLLKLAKFYGVSVDYYPVPDREQGAGQHAFIRTAFE